MANGNGGYGGGYGFRQGFGGQQFGNDQAFNNAFGTRMGVAQPYDQNNMAPGMGDNGNTAFTPRPPMPYTGDPNNMGNTGGGDPNPFGARPYPGAGFNPTANPDQGRGFPFAPPPELPPWTTPGAPPPELPPWTTPGAPGRMGVKGFGFTNLLR